MIWMKESLKIILRILFGTDQKRLIDIIQKKDYKIISFDIFDTLIVRKVGKPEALFQYVQRMISDIDSNFTEHRKEAERNIRNHLEVEEVTLSDIYHEYQKMTACSRETADFLMNLEKKTEVEICFGNKDVMELFQQCIERKIKVVITSDMYLDKEIIKTILANAGCNEYQKLYLSSNENASKRTGNLFRLMLREQGVEANEVLHIGDNPFSDYLMPRLIGIRAILLKNSFHRC